MAFDLARYNRHTEELIEFMLARADADDLLASGLPRWATFSRISTPALRAVIADYRSSVHWATHAEDVWRRLWWLCVVRYHAMLIRTEGRDLKGRDGFRREWLRAPSRRGRSIE